MTESIFIVATFGLPLAVLTLAMTNTLTALKLLNDLEDRK